MPGVRSKTRNGLYQGWYYNWQGNRAYFTGTSSKADTRRLAQRIEDEHRQIRTGYKPPPTSATRHRKRSFVEMCDEYLDWGRKQGGKNRKPWSEKHARNRSAQLRWWQQQLGFEFLGDLATGDLLARSEVELRAMSDKRTGRTVMNYAEALAAFCDWCVQRGYLENDPLKNLVGFDTTPSRIRRAMSAEEIAQLLDVCAEERRLVYEAAFLSELRAGELRSLTISDLDTQRCGLRLRAEWTKNRKSGFQYLSRDLVDRLLAFAASGTPRQLYEEAYRRNYKGDISKVPEQPLLYVPTHPGRSLYQDLKKAGISKQTAQGIVDFHAARTAYINLVFEDSELTLKDAQELARHSSADLTLNVYGRARDDRMSAAIERMAKRVIPQEKRVKYVSKQAVGAETEIATPLETKELRSNVHGSGGRTRTYDQVVNSHPLCQLSYAGITELHVK